MIGLFVLAIAGTLPAVASAQEAVAMPVAQQNALVKQYCAVCHSDAKPTGGLSLEQFDAGHPDPGVVAMMLSKLKDGAMSAAGITQPDKPVMKALRNALSGEAKGAGDWIVSRNALLVKAGIVREVRSPEAGAEPDLYRLQVTCHLDTHEGEVQVAWAPKDLPQTQAMTAAVDAKAASVYYVGQGEGATYLSAEKHSLNSAKTLTISNIFPGQTVVFPLGDLSQTMRHDLAACFTENQ